MYPHLPVLSPRAPSSDEFFYLGLDSTSSFFPALVNVKLKRKYQPLNSPMQTSLPYALMQRMQDRENHKPQLQAHQEFEYL
jgi:hypothetical protein